eukprot:2104328-Pyramimonas_sp.AAC.1
MLGVSQVPLVDGDKEDIDIDEIRDLLDDTSNLSSAGKKVRATTNTTLTYLSGVPPDLPLVGGRGVVI